MLFKVVLNRLFIEKGVMRPRTTREEVAKKIKARLSRPGCPVLV